MEDHLTMDKWDDFTLLLQENKMHDFLNVIYMIRDLLENKTIEMKNIILESATYWKKNKPFAHEEIIN